MDKLFEVRDDLFGIAERIKSIDANYKIYFNGDTRRFELYNTSRKPSFQLVLPYRTLDKRTLDYALESGVKNKEKIIREIEENNKRLEAEHFRTLFEKTMSELPL